MKVERATDLLYLSFFNNFLFIFVIAIERPHEPIVFEKPHPFSFLIDLFHHYFSLQ